MTRYEGRCPDCGGSVYYNEDTLKLDSRSSDSSCMCSIPYEDDEEEEDGDS